VRRGPSSSRRSISSWPSPPPVVSTWYAAFGAVRATSASVRNVWNFHRVGAGLGGRGDELARQLGIAVVVDAGLGDHEHGRARANQAVADAKGRGLMGVLPARAQT